MSRLAIAATVSLMMSSACVQALQFECKAEAFAACGFGRCATQSASGTIFKYDNERSMVLACREKCSDWASSKFEVESTSGKDSKSIRLRATTDTFTREYNLHIAPVLLADYDGFAAIKVDGSMVETYTGTCSRSKPN